MMILRAAVSAALIFLATTGSGRADDVTLTSRDGGLEISGDLLGFDGEFYRVDTEFGVLTVDGSGVNCDGPACPVLGTYVAEFSLSGATELGEVLIPALIEGFGLNGGFAVKREEIPGTGLLYTLYEGGQSTVAARITIRLTSSSEGFADLLGEEADMVLSLREVSAQERTMAREAGLGDLRGARQSRVIALDAVVPVVSPKNPVDQITFDGLAGVFGGSITRWSQLGGEDAPITAYLRDPETDASQVFSTRVLTPAKTAIGDKVLRHATYGGITRAVEEDPFGLGMTVFSQLGLTESVTLTGDCGFDLSANVGTIKAGDYPLTAPLYLYLPARRMPKLARDFLAYLRSDSAQMVVRRAGFVDQGLSEVSLDDQGARLANAIRNSGPEVPLSELQRMMDLFVDKKRLTLTFRFQDGSSGLDAPSRSNVSLLAAALEAGKFDGRSLTFVGFSDGAGAAATNLSLAAKRAEAVKLAVIEALEIGLPEQVTLTSDAFGEAMPMACDDTAWGRQVNRRVEIWVD